MFGNVWFCSAVMDVMVLRKLKWGRPLFNIYEYELVYLWFMITRCSQTKFKDSFQLCRRYFCNSVIMIIFQYIFFLVNVMLKLGC